MPRFACYSVTVLILFVFKFIRHKLLLRQFKDERINLSEISEMSTFQNCTWLRLYKNAIITKKNSFLF